MISTPHWRNLESKYISLDEAWTHLKHVRGTGETKLERRAVMRYLQALQQVYEASQTAVSLNQAKGNT